MVLAEGRRLVLGIAVTASTLIMGARTAGADDDSLGRSITLARLDEIAMVGAVMNEHTWPGFDVLAYPAIFYEPGGWAFAVGFTQPPPGFTPVEGARHNDRQLYHAAAGSFDHQGRSPALIGGRWTVISRFDPPDPAPAGARMGRESGEDGVGRFFGDAFAIYLMDQRKRTTPFVTGAAAYPESAELMALTTLEQRAMTIPLQMGNLYEKNIDEFHRYLKAVVAIRRARWKLMGEELAGIEKEVELTDGLRVFTTTMVHRHALNKMLNSTNPGKADGTFVAWVNSTAQRILGMGYPMLFTLDNPAVTLPQVAMRGAVLGALLDKTGAPWRPKAVEGEFSLIDFLAQTENVKPEEEQGLIDGAKQAYYYDALYKLAQADIEHLKKDRQAALRRFTSGGEGRLDIILPAGQVETYEDDPWTTVHLGEGRLTHPGGLTLGTAGLELAASAAAPGDRAELLTEAGASRKSLKLVHIVLPPAARLSVEGKPYKPSPKPRQLSETSPLTSEGPGLKLRVTRGTIASKGDGLVEVTITH